VLKCVQEQLVAGEQLLKEQRFAEAVEAFDSVLALAPREYTLAMKALLGRGDAYAVLGRGDLASADNRKEFAWGRGIRWPGWYIIAAILFRNEIVRGM
jgi:hypothetical protein